MRLRIDGHRCINMVVHVAASFDNDSLLCQASRMARGAALAAVDAALGARGPLPAPVQAMLLGDPSAPGESPPSSSPGLLGASTGVRLTMTAACPLMGVRLFVGGGWTALTPVAPARPFEHLESALHGVQLALAPDGAPCHRGLEGRQ